MPSQHTCVSIAQNACANATHYACSYHVYVNKVLWQHMYFVLCRLTSIFGSSYKQLLFYHCLCFLESLSNSGSAGFPRLQLHRTHTCTGVHQCIDLTTVYNHRGIMCAYNYLVTCVSYNISDITMFVMNEIIKDVGQLNKRVIIGGVYVRTYILIFCVKAW